MLLQAWARFPGCDEERKNKAPYNRGKCELVVRNESVGTEEERGGDSSWLAIRGGINHKNNRIGTHEYCDSNPQEGKKKAQKGGGQGDDPPELHEAHR